MKIVAPLLFLICLVSCSCNSDKEPVAAAVLKPSDAQMSKTFVDVVEDAHKKAKFLEHSAIQFDIVLSFGGAVRLDGRMTLKTNSSEGRIDYRNGRSLIFSDGEVYYSPEFENAKKPRFAAYTWSYFSLFPYKLSDPGTTWSDYSTKTLNAKVYDVNKLTFDPGTGDAPDDWYIVYADKVSKLTQIAAYIVTAGQSIEKAEEDPHAIQYLKYREIQGIPIAHQWKFWAWRTEDGLTDELGEANLTNVKFVNSHESLFKPQPNMLTG